MRLKKKIFPMSGGNYFEYVSEEDPELDPDDVVEKPEKFNELKSKLKTKKFEVFNVNFGKKKKHNISFVKMK